MDLVIGLIFYTLLLGFLLYKWASGSFLKKELSYDEIRSLIRKQMKPKITYSQNSASADRTEAYFYNLQETYKIALMFGKASLSPQGKLTLSNKDIIEPHSKAHGLEALENALNLREEIIEKYHIDLEDLSDKTSLDVKTWH